MAAAGERDRDELEAALGARQDLGPAYEPALVESFLDRMETTIEARVDARLAERGEQSGGVAARAATAQRQFVRGIVGVNVAHAWSARKNE